MLHESRIQADRRPTGAPGAVRCRPIVDDDLDAVVALLVEGFKGHSEGHWRRGIGHHLANPLPEGLPRLGYVLEAESGLVGVLLTLYSVNPRDQGAAVVCNLSSWYVKPAFRLYAGLLDKVATGRRDVTYLNISAIRSTWPIQEARGFRRLCSGEFVALPLLSRPRPGVRVRDVRDAGPQDLPEAETRLLADHRRFGCVALVASDAEGSAPFVFVRRKAETLRQRLGWSPLSYFHLVYCRSTADLPRFAHAIGRHLLSAHAMPWIAVDADGPVPGLHGLFVKRWGTKFVRGPMRRGDLSYTELALFHD